RFFYPSSARGGIRSTIAATHRFKFQTVKRHRPCSLQRRVRCIPELRIRFALKPFSFRISDNPACEGARNAGPRAAMVETFARLEARVLETRAEKGETRREY